MTTAKQEWASMWPLPLVALIGNAGSACFAFASGAMMGDLTKEFGWTRAEFSTAFTLQMLLALVIAPIVGPLIDRIGPRRAALTGILPFVIGLSALSLVSGPIWQWWALCAVQAFLVALVGPTVWMKAVVGRFVVSRGMAMAVALTGVGLAGAIWPPLAAYCVEHFGWRLTFPILACVWGLIVFPLTYLFFFGAEDRAPEPGRPAAKVRLGQLVASRAFVGLALGGALSKSLSYGLTVHMIPLLQGRGMGLSGAAALAGLVGVSAVAGRIITGFLLDTCPTRRVALAVFILPVGVSLLLLAGAQSGWSTAAACMLLGFLAGAVSDILAFLVARMFPQEVFAAVYANLMAVISVGASIGPLLAGLCFDQSGSYDLYLYAIIPLALISTGLVALTPSAAKQPAMAH